MNVGEATRLYQAALEERRVMRDRDDDPDGRIEEIEAEVRRAEDDLWSAWRVVHVPPIPDGPWFD